MILYYCEKDVYTDVFIQSLSMFLSKPVEILSFNKTYKTDLIELIVIDGATLHAQRLGKVLKQFKGVPVVFLSDGIYKNSQITLQVQANTPASDVAKIVLKQLHLSDLYKDIHFNKKEEKLLNGLEKGLSNKQISRQIDMPIHNVKYHLQNIYAKLGVDNRTQAALKLRDIPL